MSLVSNFFEAARGKPYHHALLLGGKTTLTEAANKEAWACFCKSVKESYSPKVIERAQKRYNFTLNPENDQPLLVKHVLAIQAAGADIRSGELAGQRLTRQEVSAQMPELIPPEKPLHKLRGGCPTVGVRQYLIPNRIFMDQKRLQLYNGIENLSWDAFLERLAKAIISHPLEVGMIIPTPDGNKRPGIFLSSFGEDKGRDYYEVAYLGGEEGLEICALVPVAIDSNLPPIIVFQPTQLTLEKQGISTVFNDLDPQLGLLGYKASEEVIKEVMDDPRFKKGNVVLTGYSLGGNHAQRLLTDFPSAIGRAVFFNDPSPTGDAVAMGFAKVVNRPDWKKPIELVIYRTVFIDESGNRYEDLTTAFGGKHAGYGITNPYVTVRVVELQYRTTQTELKKRHVKRCLDGNPAKADRLTIVEIPRNEINAKLDNARRDGGLGWIETARKWFVSSFVYPILNFAWTISKEVLRFVLKVLFGEERTIRP